MFGAPDHEEVPGMNLWPHVYHSGTLPHSYPLLHVVNHYAEPVSLQMEYKDLGRRGYPDMWPLAASKQDMGRDFTRLPMRPQMWVISMGDLS